jgi:hypothetical protein
MQRMLEEAIEHLKRLPTRDQEAVARHVVVYVEKLRPLRDELDEGIESLKGGYCRPLDIDNLSTSPCMHRKEREGVPVLWSTAARTDLVAIME